MSRESFLAMKIPIAKIFMSKRSSFERGRKRSFLLTSSHFLLWPATNKPMHDEDEEEDKEEEEETSRIVVAIR